MTTDPTTPYPVRNLAPPELPPRSRLFHLEPLGVGTAQVESLTSYLSRLARAHSVSVRQLALAEMVPLLARHYPGEVAPRTFSGINHAINGTGRGAIMAILALEALTMRHDLRFLTMWSWRHIISNKKLLRSTRAWCPVCYEDWRQAGQILYEPLLWALTAITICPQHQQRLHHYCPHQACRATLPAISPTGKNGYCPRCQGWLGGVETEKGVTEPISVEEIWQANLAGEFLAAAPFLPTPPAKDSLVRMIVTAAERNSNGNVSALARQVGVSPSRLHNMVKATGALYLGLLLDSCYRLTASPLDFLPNQITEQADGDSHTLLAAGLNRLDLAQMEQVLTAILASDQLPPPSLRDAARQLDQVEPNLHRHFPDLCRAIIDRRRQYYQAERVRIQHQLDAILAGDDVLLLTEVAQRLECRPGLLRSWFPELCQKIVARRQADHTAEKVKIQQALKTIVAREESPPPLLRDVAQRLEQSPTTLRAYCPALCRIIVERRQRYRAAEKVRIQHELEAILANEEPPPPLYRVIERFDLTAPTFYRLYPALCQAITTRYRRYKAVGKLKLQGQLEAILADDDSPPLAMAEVARRLEQSAGTLYSAFPELCQAIVERHQRYLAAEKLSMQQALEALLVSDEEPPPSVADVARQFDCDSTRLWRNFPKLCRMILKRRRQHQAVRKARAQHEFEAILARHEEPPPSVAEVARRLTYNSATLRRHFPAACQHLATRRQSYLAAKKLKAQQTLEAALAGAEEPPLSVVDVARQLGSDPTTLGRQFPELCQALVERRRQFKAAELLQLQTQLEAVLASDELPPPSLSEATQQLEPRPRTLWTFFPELCQAITDRHQNYREAEQLRVQHEMEAILTSDELPPPSLEEVSRRIAYNGSLRHTFPELCQTIVERHHNYQTVEQLRIQHELETILAREATPLPSLAEVAQQLGCSSTRICTLCPELARQLSTKYLAHQKDLRAQMTMQLCLEVQQATFQIYREGLYPTQHQVALRLAKSTALFFNPKLKAAWRRALHELGLSE